MALLLETLKAVRVNPSIPSHLGLRKRKRLDKRRVGCKIIPGKG
jgi:hypothetical protein